MKRERIEIPTAAKYKETLQTLNFTPDEKKMLLAHHRAHNRAITATTLAAAMGSVKFGTGNLFYGLLGSKLGEALGFRFGPLDDRDPAGKRFQSSVIGMEMPEGCKSTDEFELVMHHELAKALDQLDAEGWFQSIQ